MTSMNIKILRISLIVKTQPHITEMSYFTVEQLVDFSFSEKLLYVLPEAVKKMLVELESCLEITDANPAESTDRREHHKYSSDARRSSEESGSVRHYRNRYEMDTDKGKKRDYKKTGGGSDWRSGTSSSSVTPSASSASLKDDIESEWEMMRAFKATKIESKTGIEKVVNDIRIALNKMSTGNYEKQRDAVLGLVNGYFAEEDAITEENTRRISKAIFDIASTNKFYSEIYAKLYKELVSVQLVFSNLLEEFVNGFTSMESVPIYIDPDVDYDGFCVYSKACEVRKSTSTFLVNCLKMGLIDPSRISDILCEFLKFVEVKRREDGVVKSVEEIVENIYIIATLCSGDLSKTKKWREYVVPTIKRIIAEKTSGYPGMSNRANFKLMDLLEKI